MMLRHVEVEERPVHVLARRSRPHHAAPVAFVLRPHLLQRQGTVAFLEVALDSVVAREVFCSVLIFIFWNDTVKLC